MSQLLCRPPKEHRHAELGMCWPHSTRAEMGLCAWLHISWAPQDLGLMEHVQQAWLFSQTGYLYFMCAVTLRDPRCINFPAFTLSGQKSSTEIWESCLQYEQHEGERKWVWHYISMQYIYTKLAAVIWVEVIIPVLAGHHFMHYNVILILQVISACFFSSIFQLWAVLQLDFHAIPSFPPL